MGHFRKTLSVLYSKCEKCTASVRRGFAKTSTDLFLNLDVANGKGGVWGGIFHLLRCFLLAEFGWGQSKYCKKCLGCGIIEVYIY